MGIFYPFESPSLILLGVLSTQHKFSGHYHVVITHFRTPEISYPLLTCQHCLAELPLWKTQLCAYQSSWVCLRKDSPVLTGLIFSWIVNPLSGTSVLPGIHYMFPQSIHSLFSWRTSSYFPLSPVSADGFASFFPKMFERIRKNLQIPTSTHLMHPGSLPLALCIHRDAVTAPSPSHIIFFILCSQACLAYSCPLDFVLVSRCLEHSASRYIWFTPLPL